MPVSTSRAVGLRARVLAGTAVLTAVGIAAVGAPTTAARAEVLPVGAVSANAWRLQYAESFDANVSDSKSPWFKDGDGPTSRYNVTAMTTTAPSSRPREAPPSSSS